MILMRNNFILEPAYILHTKNYRETSLIIRFFTRNYGIVHAIARSARGTRSRFRGCLIPFAPLLITGTSKTDLMQLFSAEATGPACFLQGDALFNALYLNELVIRLLPCFDPYPNLFLLYQQAL